MYKNHLSKPYASLILLDVKRLIKKRFFLPMMKSKLKYYVQYRKRAGKSRDNEEVALSKELKSVISNYVKDSNWKYEVVQYKEGSYVIRIIEKGVVTMYCKVACNKSFCEFAIREKECYDYLRTSVSNELVDFIYADYISEQEFVIISKALKRKSLFLLSNLYAKLMREIDEFAKGTSQKVLFEESDYYKQLQFISQNIATFPDKKLAESVQTYINEYRLKHEGKQVQYSYYYGDCRVENMAYYKGKVTWYDFQRGMISYPPYLDKYHLICLYVNLDSETLQKVLPSFDWYNKENFAEFLVDFFGRFLTANEERANKHLEWFLESFRTLWYSMVI